VDYRLLYTQRALHDFAEIIGRIATVSRLAFSEEFLVFENRNSRSILKVCR
jgi:hypothetical protein